VCMHFPHQSTTAREREHDARNVSAMPADKARFDMRFLRRNLMDRDDALLPCCAAGFGRGVKRFSGIVCNRIHGRLRCRHVAIEFRDPIIDSPSNKVCGMFISSERPVNRRARKTVVTPWKGFRPLCSVNLKISF
jgi:hypothetical protein